MSTKIRKRHSVRYSATVLQFEILVFKVKKKNFIFIYIYKYKEYFGYCMV